MSGYIGNIPTPQATQTRETFTATASQTTFNTAGYTPGFVDVWLNGVKLVNGDDFTATNGSDVVLTVGAASGDTVEVLSFSTFEVNSQTFTGDTSAVNLNVTGTFTSRGIDDNATSTAMTLDASGNVLVGKTAADNTTAGGSIFAGVSSFVNDGARALTLVRNTSDGDIVEFRKGGTTVGSIGTTNSVGFGTTYLEGPPNSSGLLLGNIEILPHRNGVRSDGLIDIGDGSYRFKDAYLSGGVYLGGTGAANKLDDYETGTWTATLTSITGGSLVAANYVKVGRLVTVFITFTCTAAPTANSSRFSLPFTPDGPNIFGHGTWSIATVDGGALEVQSSNAVCYFAQSGSSGGTYLGTATYQTA